MLFTKISVGTEKNPTDIGIAEFRKDREVTAIICYLLLLWQELDEEQLPHPHPQPPVGEALSASLPQVLLSGQPIQRCPFFFALMM